MDPAGGPNFGVHGVGAKFGYLLPFERTGHQTPNLGCKLSSLMSASSSLLAELLINSE